MKWFFLISVFLVVSRTVAKEEAEEEDTGELNYDEEFDQLLEELTEERIVRSAEPGKRNTKKKGQKKRKKDNKPKKSQKTFRRQGTGRQSTCPVSSSCLSNATSLLKLCKDKVTNFLMQQKRIAKFNSTGGKKAGKKGLFGPIASKVIDVGGGNASDLACSGNKTNAGAASLTNITVELKLCETKIHAACDPSNYPLPNMTETTACVTVMKSLKTMVKTCLKKSGSEACTCWTNSSMATMASQVKECDLSAHNKNVTAQHSTCKATFSACKKIEDSAVTYIFACSQSVASLTAKAKQAKANVAALTSAKTKTSTLAGSSSGRRAIRALTTCAEVIATNVKLLAAGDNAPTSAGIETLGALVAAVSDTLTCSTSEKSSLTTQATSYTAVIEKVNSTLAGLTASLTDAGGSSAAAAVETATTSSSATATARMMARKNRLVRDILNHLN